MRCDVNAHAAAAYRFPFCMGGGSVLFKQDSPYYEHFYQQLKVVLETSYVIYDTSHLTTSVAVG